MFSRTAGFSVEGEALLGGVISELADESSGLEGRPRCIERLYRASVLAQMHVFTICK